MHKSSPYDSASIIKSLPSKESKEILMRILASSSGSENLTRIKRPRHTIEDYRHEISSDEDIYAGDDDRDEEFILEGESDFSSSETDSSEVDLPASKRSNISIDIERNEHRAKPKINIKHALYTLNESLSKLSHSVATLQQEFNELRTFPPLSSSVMPEIVEKQNSFPMGCDDITFSLNTDSVTIPIREREKVTTMNTMLQNDGVFSQALIHFKRVFGEQKQRNMTKTLKKLMSVLIIPECLSNFTWTGKTKKGTKIAFKNFKNIQKLLIQTMQSIDDRYSSETFKIDMVGHVLKYAHEHEPQKRQKKNEKMEEIDKVIS